MVKLARRIKYVRDDRNALFGHGLFGEQGWDMLLALYIAEGEGYRLKVGDLCNESLVPQSIAIRWIEPLVELHMAHRRSNPLDTRSIFVEIQPATAVMMTRFLEATDAKCLRVDC